MRQKPIDKRSNFHRSYKISVLCGSETWLLKSDVQRVFVHTNLFLVLLKYSKRMVLGLLKLVKDVRITRSIKRAYYISLSPLWQFKKYKAGDKQYNCVGYKQICNLIKTVLIMERKLIVYRYFCAYGGAIQFIDAVWGPKMHKDCQLSSTGISAVGLNRDERTSLGARNLGTVYWVLEFYP